MATTYLDDVDQINKRIQELNNRVLVLMYTDSERCIDLDASALKSVGDIRVELDNLLRARYIGIKECYSPKSIASYKSST